MQLLFAPDGDPQLLRLGELGTSRLPRDQHIGLGRHRTSYLGAQRLQCRLGIVARQGGQGAGQHKGFAGKGLLRGLFLLDGRPMDAGSQQGFQHLHVMGLTQEVVDMLGYHIAHVGYFEQLLHRSRAQGIQGEEVVGKIERCRLPHFADPQGKQEARQGGAARRIDGGYQIEGRFLPHPLKTCQLDGIEAEQISGSLHQPLVYQLLDNLVAKAVHIHGATGGKVLDRLLALRLAEQAAGAAGNGLSFQPLYCRATHRALGREENFPRINRALCLYHGHDLRDHVSCPAHDHGIADHYAKALDLVGVVQSGIGDSHAADKHRFELGHRRHGASTTNLKLDILKQGHLLLRRELVGGRPARRACHKAELLLQSDGIHLVDHAVDLVRQLATAGQNVVVERLTTGSPLFEFHLGTKWQPPLFELIEATKVRATELLAADTDTVGVKAQGTAGSDT